MKLGDSQGKGTKGNWREVMVDAYNQNTLYKEQLGNAENRRDILP